MAGALTGLRCLSGRKFGLQGGQAVAVPLEAENLQRISEGDLAPGEVAGVLGHGRLQQAAL